MNLKMRLYIDLLECAVENPDIIFKPVHSKYCREYTIKGISLSGRSYRFEYVCADDCPINGMPSTYISSTIESDFDEED